MPSQRGATWQTNSRARYVADLTAHPFHPKQGESGVVLGACAQ